MEFSFADRADISLGERITISGNVVRGAMAILNMDPAAMQNAFKDNYIISCAYWLLNIVDSEVVDYNNVPPPPGVPASAAGQQGAGYVGLAYMMGLVKDPTSDNAPACKKRWAAGLAGISRVSALSDGFTEAVWRYIVDRKHTLYSHTTVRREIMLKYLSMQNRDQEPAISRAVLSQLDLIYKDAYLKSVNLMHLFTESGSRALEIPSILEEVMKLDDALAYVKSIEGANYSTCRLIDNNKYPTLNHANYPNLYAATLEWARRSKKVQKNYLGSKALLDQAINQDIVKRVLKMTSASLGSGSLTQEQLDWLRTKKGYRVPATPLSELLSSKSTKRRAEVTDSDTTESESEDDQEHKRGRKRKARRHH